MRSGNAHIHGMRVITKASLAYMATQVCSIVDICCAFIQVFSYAGPLCSDFCPSLFSHRSCNWFQMILQQYCRAVGRSGGERWSQSVNGVVESVKWLYFIGVYAYNILRQIFLLYTEVERLPSQDSVLSRIRQKRVEYRERAQSVEIWLLLLNVVLSTLECHCLHLVL